MMCQSIYLEDEDLDIDSLGELVGRFGVDALVWHPGYDYVGRDGWEDWCLCGLNLLATAEQAGYASRFDETGDPMQFIWRKVGRQA